MYKSITLSGPVASGTTTTAKALAEKLGLDYHSAGDFFRKYSLDHHIPLYAKEKIPDDLDREIDKKLAKLAENGGVVIDAHYIGYFTKDIPHVLKVLLTCDYQTRIKRAIKRVSTHAETEGDIKKREEGLDKKFRKLYADEYFLDPKFFDLVIDDTDIPPEEVVEQVSDKFLSSSS